MTEIGPNQPADPPAGNIPEYSVTELSAALKRTLEDTFGRVRVRGEVTRVYRAASGHAYITLKDEKAVLEGVCFRGSFERLRFKPEQGLEIICTGRVSTFAGKSQYQIVIEQVEPAGAGALMALLEDRRKKLAAEGLFDEARKKDLPYLPEVVGVVTSPTGAVIRDILHRLRERFPRHVLLWPTLVQGDAAAAHIAAAIQGFNRLPPGGPVPRPDVLIVARGGGSLEDLWAFNEEAVVRAAAASDIPLISAVGHETDTTLIDYAADVRAPTPTAAAEFAVPVREDLLYTVADYNRRLIGGLRRRLAEAQTSVRAAGRGLRDPRDLLNALAQRLDDLTERLARGLSVGLERRNGRLREAAGGRRLSRALAGDLRRHRHTFERSALRLRRRLVSERLREHRHVLDGVSLRLHRDIRRRLETHGERAAALGKLLETLSYQNVLERGFALVRDEGGKPLKDAQAALPGMGLMIEFRDGTLEAKATGEAKPKAPAKRARRRGKPEKSQGDLF